MGSTRVGFSNNKSKEENGLVCCVWGNVSDSEQEVNMAMKLTSLEELKDRELGSVGKPKRDEFEGKLAVRTKAYHVGEAIRLAREARSMTQAELGERMGVHRSQICRMESGKSITLASMMRAFRAMGVEVSLDMKGVGTVTL